MAIRIRGRAWTFGDDLSADVHIMPFEMVRKSNALNLEELARMVLTAVDPEFPSKVRRGDILVAGRNFGCGKPHTQGVAALKALGLGAIVADSISRGYFRKALALGLPAIICPGISRAVRTGDTLEIDLNAGAITNLTTGAQAAFGIMPAPLMEILEAGGLTAYLRTRVQAAEGQEARA